MCRAIPQTARTIEKLDLYPYLITKHLLYFKIIVELKIATLINKTNIDDIFKIQISTRLFHEADVVRMDLQ